MRLITGIFVVIMATWFTYTGYNKWQQTIHEANSCSFVPNNIKSHFRYIQFIINRQNLRNPVFDGRYFINLGNEFGNGSYQLSIIQAGKRGYAATTLNPALNWDEGFKAIVMQDSKDISFVADNSHYMFPFDSAQFDETFDFQPTSTSEQFF